MGHLTTWGIHLSVSYLFTFSYCSWGSQGKNTEVVWAIPFSSGPHFVRTLHPETSILGGLHSMTHSFIELDNTVVHVISLVRFLWLWILFLCSLIETDKRVWQPPDERDWVRGKLGLVLMGGAMLSKSLIQFSVEKRKNTEKEFCLKPFKSQQTGSFLFYFSQLFLSLHVLLLHET